MNTLLKTTLFTLAFMILFAGCGGTSPAPQSSSQQTPKWFTSPSQTDSQYFYGTGMGDSKEEARVAALNSIASEISVTVSSNTEISKRVTESSYSKDVQQQLTSSVEEMKFTGVEIIDSTYVNGKFFYYVKVDRNVLYQSNIKELEKTVTDLESLYQLSRENGSFYFLSNRENFESLINKALIKLPLIKAINSGFNDEKYLSKFINTKDSVDKKISNLTIGVTSTNANPYAEVVKNHLSSIGVKLSQRGQGADYLKITVSKTDKEKIVKTTNPKLKGAKFAIVDVTLKTVNSAGKTVSQNTVKVTNISKDSYEDAVKKTSKFNRYIQRNGIVTTITGN